MMEVKVETTQISTVSNDIKEWDSQQEYVKPINHSIESSNKSANYNKSRRRNIANGVVVFAIISPLVVMFWRGTWGILDLFIFPSNIVKSAWTCTGFGFGFIFLYMNLQQHLIRILQSCNWLKKAVEFVWFPYVYVIACSTVASWRGVWYILDFYFTASSLSALVTHIFGVVVLCLPNTFATVIAAPGFIIRNWKIQPLSFNLAVLNCLIPPQLSSRKPSLANFLNYFVTTFIIGIGTICYWRGTWTLMNNLYPKEKINTLSICLAVGYVVVLCCYCFNDMLRTKLEFYRFYKFAMFIQFLFAYVLAFGVVSIWKGFWDLIDFLSLLLPGQHLWIVICSCHATGFIFLSVMKASSNLVSSPAGCRICGPASLSGFDMGSFLEPPHEMEIAHNNSLGFEGNEKNFKCHYNSCHSDRDNSGKIAVSNIN